MSELPLGNVLSIKEMDVCATTKHKGVSALLSRYVGDCRSRGSRRRVGLFDHHLPFPKNLVYCKSQGRTVRHSAPQDHRWESSARICKSGDMEALKQGSQSRNVFPVIVMASSTVASSLIRLLPAAVASDGRADAREFTRWGIEPG